VDDCVKNFRDILDISAMDCYILQMKITNIGFPNVYQSLIKQTVEKYWKGEATGKDVQGAFSTVEKYNIEAQKDLDLIPVGDVDLYDRLLRTAVRFGIVPLRFGELKDALQLPVYFGIARGVEDRQASPMVKWFNTNYHVVQPEIERDFAWQPEAPLPDLSDPRRKLALIGPWTFLSYSINRTSKSTKELFQILSAEYTKFLNSLPAHTIIQLEEPSFITHGMPEGYENFLKGIKNKVHLHVYFGSVNDFSGKLFSLPVAGIGLDFWDGSENLSLLSSFPKDKILIAGILNGHNVWPVSARTERILKEIQSKISDDRLYISPSCSLAHVPLSARGEDGNFSFAEEKIAELAAIKAGKANYSKFDFKDVDLPAKRFERNRKTYWVSDIAYPTTTIGSFPQTAEVRNARKELREKKLSQADYDKFIKDKTKECVQKQDELGLDLLVHGEFERNDMVQYFAENFSGYAVIKGPVQSYGTRHVRPPVITGPVSRKDGAFTVPWITFAQSCTKKPVKGMLTGPVTIVKWSFPREDVSAEAQFYDIAGALSEEVKDLVNAGIKHIQIDEPALREGLPLDKKLHASYLRHAVNAFRAVYAQVADDVVIHTHMCFSEFKDILDTIKDMGADVLLIEDSKSKGKLSVYIKESGFPASIGLGVYDVHSPRVPTVEEILAIPESLDMDPHRIWINPDCGLKTRGDEAWTQLERMMEAVKILRKEVKK